MAEGDGEEVSSLGRVDDSPLMSFVFFFLCNYLTIFFILNNCLRAQFEVFSPRVIYWIYFDIYLSFDPLIFPLLSLMFMNP